MCITTADVRNIICLFYLKVHQYITAEDNGIDCNKETLLSEIKTLLKHYEFGCYYDDFIREYVEDNEGDLDLCTGYDVENGIPE